MSRKTRKMPYRDDTAKACISLSAPSRAFALISSSEPREYSSPGPFGLGFF